MQVYYDKDADLSIIQGKKVAVIGYGSQGHAHACNLKDSGVDVRVGLRPNSPTAKKAQAHGLTVKDVPAAVKEADVVMILTPDEFQSKLYRDEIEPNLKKGAALAFAHGFAIHYNQVVPRADLDVRGGPHFARRVESPDPRRRPRGPDLRRPRARARPLQYTHP